MKSSCYTKLIRLQMRKIRLLVRNDHSRIVKILNVQICFFVQKRVSKETNTQNLLAKWLSTKNFRNHEFFRNMQVQKQRFKGWKFDKSKVIN